METFLMVRLTSFSLFQCAQVDDVDWQSETLKYLYLLFSDNSVLPLDSALLISIPCWCSYTSELMCHCYS